MLPNIALQEAAESDKLFSVLTPVYKGTSVEYFRLTADSLRRQVRPFFEWIILAQGPISDELDAELRWLADADTRCRVLRRPVNLGIIGGTALCLAEASGSYIVPVDGDDLLAEDALATLATAIEANDRPALLYSDEDILVGTERRDAYRRPDWDEVLNLASSYIWHLCAIRRDAALEAGIYASSDGEWCHDWDTVFRIVKTGSIPVHVPAVLYHWRRHPASSTNRPDPESGSRRSTRALLEAAIASQPHPEHFEVADFPIFRGAPEWSIRRKPSDPPAVLGISLGGPTPWRAPVSRSLVLGKTLTKRSIWRSLFRSSAFGAFEFASPQALALGLANADEPFVAICGGAEPADEAWFYEAIGLLELHSNVVSVHGPILDPSERVLRGGEVFASDGTLVCPLAGKRYANAGPFALMHKPHRVAIAPTDFFVCRTDALRGALAVFGESTLAGLGIRLGQWADEQKLAIAYSPIVKAMLTSHLIDGHPRDSAVLARRILGLSGCKQMGRAIRGAAGFLEADRYLFKY